MNDVWCFPSNLNYFLSFFETQTVCAVNFGATGVTGDFPWKDVNFFYESHPNYSFQNILPHLCLIHISKMYNKRKNVFMSDVPK